MFYVLLVLIILIFASAIAALTLKNFLGATAAASVVSLGVAILFVLLRAPDVAMTEAVIGAGLSSLLLALALKRLGLWKIEVQQEQDDD